MSQISFSSSWHCQNKSAGHTSKATPTPSKPVASHVTQPGMSASPLLHFLVLKSTISFEFQNLSGKYTSLKNPMRLFHSNCPPEQKLLVLFDVPCYPSIILSKEMVDLKCLLVLLYDLVDINSVEDKNLSQSWFVFDFCPKVYYPLSNSGVKSKPNCYLFSKTLLTQGILFCCGKHDPKLAA